MAGGRQGRPPGAARRPSTLLLLLVPAVAALLLLAFLLSAASGGIGGGGGGSPAAPAAAALLRRQAADHLALIHAYAAYARRLKLQSSRQLQLFSSLSAALAAPSADEKETRDRIKLARSLVSESKDSYDTQIKIQKLRDTIKLARSLVSESKDSYDTQIKIQKLRDTIFAAKEQLSRARKLGKISSQIAAMSTPKSLHCLNMRLVQENIAHPDLYPAPPPLDLTPDLYHFAIFSDNVIAVSVVINSAVRNSGEPWRCVFHIVSDSMYHSAMRVWFAKRPPSGGARVEIKSVSDFSFLSATHSIKRGDLVLDYLRFYLAEMYPDLRRIVYLEDDVVVQRDLAGLWRVELDGKVNGAVEMCFGGFKRYKKYMNFSNPAVHERFNPRACAWSYGVNVFDLDAWRREQCTEKFHEYQMLNEEGTLWAPESVLSAGLMTFYTSTKPLDKSWHVNGLGYNPNISPDEIRNAAVIHFNGNMKPWLDIAMNQYKNLWTKYVDTDMEFLQLCNFGI